VTVLNADSRFLKGKKYFNEKKYPKAQKEFLNCLAIMPEHDEAHYYLAFIHYHQQEFPKAMDHIKQAKHHNQLLSKVRLRLNKDVNRDLLTQKSEMEERKQELWDQYYKTSDQQLKVTLRRTILELERQLNEIHKKLSEKQETKHQIPAPYHLLHGNIAFQQKDFKAAYSQYMNALRVDPDYGDAYNNLANLYFTTGQFKGALQSLQIAESKGLEINKKFKADIEKKLKQ